jgi:hypothetical protein
MEDDKKMKLIGKEKSKHVPSDLLALSINLCPHCVCNVVMTQKRAHPASSEMAVEQAW